jgi:hypothetical protein
VHDLLEPVELALDLGLEVPRERRNCSTGGENGPAG